jgi:DNA-binding NarL/FixJ family response regulator
MKNALIKIALVEDHEEIRNGLTYLINNTKGFICHDFGNAEDALKFLSSVSIDVVLMDINLPGMSGIECTSLIRDKYPNTHVIMCTVYEDDEKIFKALEAGANGYILKKTSSPELILAINEVLDGASPMSGEIARKVVQSFRKKNSNPSNVLSERELEILDLLSIGYSNKEIGEKIFISPHTVRNHLYKIYEKLHVNSRIEAMNKINSFKK